MAARLLPGGHSTTTSLLPGGCPPAAQRLSVCYLSVCCTATVRMLPVCYPPATCLLPFVLILSRFSPRFL